MSEEAKRIFAQTFVSHPYSRGDTWVPQKRAVAAVELALASSQAEIARLREALRKLAAEVGGLRNFESELRAELGNTNWSVLMLRLSEAEAALSETRSDG